MVKLSIIVLLAGEVVKKLFLKAFLPTYYSAGKNVKNLKKHQ